MGQPEFPTLKGLVNDVAEEVAKAVRARATAAAVDEGGEAEGIGLRLLLSAVKGLCVEGRISFS